MPGEIFETPQPIQPVTEPKSSNWPKMILVSVLGFVLLAGAAFAGYYYGTKEISKLKDQISNLQLKTQLQPTPTLEPTPTPTPTTAPTVKDETKDWEVYTNTKYGYSLRHPKNFQVVEDEVFISPPESGGGTTVREKGDRVRIHNERSWLAIHIDDSFRYPSIGSICLGKSNVSVSEIMINGDVLYEVDSLTTGGFLMVASKYEERELGKQQVLCPEGVWLHDNRKISIAAENPPGVAQEDNQVVRQILSTFKFLD